MLSWTRQVDGRSAAVLAATAAAAFAVSRIPFVRTPFRWYETYFHEISHGLAAVATGGDVVRLELRLDGSGTLWHAGSWLPAAVSFAGYAGAFVFGALLYLAAATSSPRYAGRIGLGMGASVALSAALWVRDLQSLAVAAVLAASFLGLWKLGGNRVTNWLIRFVGAYVVIGAFYSPAWLLWSDGGHNDASALRQSTAVPEAVWVAAWLLSGLLVVRWAARVAVRVRSGRAAAEGGRPEVSAPGRR